MNNLIDMKFVIKKKKQPYIVYMGEVPAARTYAPEDHHLNLLAAVTGK